MKIIQEHLTSAWKTAESDTETKDTVRRETEDETKEECLAATVVSKINPLALKLDIYSLAHHLCTM